MTNETNRRAVLGAILAAGAIGSVPAAARAAGSHPDAKLLALASEIEAADRENELRERAINAAETVFFSIRPKEPERPTITYQAMEELIAQKRWDEITKFGAEVRKQEAALKAWQEDEIPRARRNRVCCQPRRRKPKRTKFASDSRREADPDPGADA